MSKQQNDQPNSQEISADELAGISGGVKPEIKVRINQLHGEDPSDYEPVKHAPVRD